MSESNGLDGLVGKTILEVEYRREYYDEVSEFTITVEGRRYHFYPTGYDGAEGIAFNTWEVENESLATGN